MPLSGLDPSMLWGFVCRDEGEWGRFEEKGWGALTHDLRHRGPAANVARHEAHEQRRRAHSARRARSNASRIRGVLCVYGWWCGARLGADERGARGYGDVEKGRGFCASVGGVYARRVSLALRLRPTPALSAASARHRERWDEARARRMHIKSTRKSAPAKERRAHERRCGGRSACCGHCNVARIRAASRRKRQARRVRARRREGWALES
ncbi:hypothetical protein FB451DRAFT_154230 [Mycena latifolia]|nr:hypothetical protein FB451DRAFT_154230 [Mycena latifolia]